MIVQWKKHEKTCNCKPTYMQPIDKTYHLRGECSLWQVNYGRFWLDNSSETPRRFFNAKNAQDLFTDPSWTWLPGRKLKNSASSRWWNCVCKSFVGGKFSIRNMFRLVIIWIVHLSKSANYMFLVCWPMLHPDISSSKKELSHTLQSKFWLPNYATFETLSVLSFQSHLTQFHSFASVEAVSADHLVYTCHAQKGLLAVALVML